MNATPVSADFSPQQWRGKRLSQISILVAIALILGGIVPVMQGNWQVLLCLFAGVVSMLLCHMLNHHGNQVASGSLLIWSMTTVAACLMWLSDGLRSSVNLFFPVILIIAGMLVKVRQYLALLLSMALYAVFITLATQEWGLRPHQTIDHSYDIMLDMLLVLLVGGFGVWVLLNDLQLFLKRLTEQVGLLGQAQEDMVRVSMHDSLTGLPNRTFGRELVERALLEAQRRKMKVALMFVNLDHFKTINDSLGHAAGDEFLQQVSNRLREGVRKSDIVMRHGGDEFVIALIDVSDVKDASKVANGILGRITEPFKLAGVDVSASCSIGVSIYPDDGLDYETLMRQVDMAVFQAKEAGRNTVMFFDKVMQDSLQTNLLLVASIRVALARREFVLHYQPVIDLSSGKLVGAEALIRWQHPDKGLLSPYFFITAAEKSGLIVEMGEWVLREACRQVSEWIKRGCEPFVISVNLSPVQFKRGNVEEMIESALLESELSPSCLELEITESTLVQDVDKFMLSLQRIKAMGIKISIDDFGTGYSNLSYLQRFEVDKLKIDRSFVMQIMKGPQERALVAAIIQMAKSLNLTTNAEGIEEDDVRKELLALGCDLGQGYFFDRPLTPEKFEQLIFPSVIKQP
jgi:diguanylate cyclase